LSLAPPALRLNRHTSADYRTLKCGVDARGMSGLLAQQENAVIREPIARRPDRLARLVYTRLVTSSSIHHLLQWEDLRLG
jgi:hypothetical protein